MRTLTLLLFAEDFLCFRLGVIRKCTIFALLQRMIFSHCTCTFGLFSFRFSLELFRLFNKPLFFFFCETSGLLNRFDELLKKRRRMYTGSEIPFRSTTARLFLKPGNARIRLDFWQNSERLPRESVTIVSVCVCFGEPRLLAKIQSDWDLELGLNFSCCVC
uniref:(northern house mosquito) hypothetical protein n=1 Tax=Culex pipiens TaxID=7175 RepID=A0A8D8IAS9_CULPI